MKKFNVHIVWKDGTDSFFFEVVSLKYGEPIILEKGCGSVVYIIPSTIRMIQQSAS